MTQDKKTVQLSAEHLAQLLGESMAVEADAGEDADEAKRDFLDLQLACEVSPSARPADGPSSPEPESFVQTAPHESVTVGQALLDPRTPLAVLEGIKEIGKRLSSRQDRPVEHDVGTALYYAAIAAALAHHGRKITSWPDRDLADALADVAARAWIPVQIRDVLARAHCLAQVKSTGQATAPPTERT